MHMCALHATRACVMIVSRWTAADHRVPPRCFAPRAPCTCAQLATPVLTRMHRIQQSILHLNLSNLLTMTTTMMTTATAMMMMMMILPVTIARGVIPPAGCIAKVLSVRLAPLSDVKRVKHGCVPRVTAINIPAKHVYVNHLRRYHHQPHTGMLIMKRVGFEHVCVWNSRSSSQTRFFFFSFSFFLNSCLHV
jgi:hypothetical protein